MLSATDGRTAEGKATATLTAAQIVGRHIAARGGLQTWRAVQALSLRGKMEVGRGSDDRSQVLAAQGRRGRNTKAAAAAADAPAVKAGAEAAPQVQLPFVMELKRPGRSRVEIDFAGKTAVQVYDGKQGWKLRPYLNRSDAEPFTAQEAKTVSAQDALEGPLVDYAAKGSKVELVAVGPVEGHDAYELKLTKNGGQVQRIWIDAQSFLDIKVEAVQRRMDGRLREVWVYQRDFRRVHGLMMPFLLETAVEGDHDTHKMMIERVAVNPQLDDALFSKPKA
jgi:outer membrane lipoprotein-sorting protein